MLSHHDNYRITVFDKLTYAGNLDNLLQVQNDPRYSFVRGDICNRDEVETAVKAHDIDTIINFAAESHVDRSIMDPDAFIQTSVYGTYTLLEVARSMGLERYHQISTDEVYGHIPAGQSSKETDKVDPRSPYAAIRTARSRSSAGCLCPFGSDGMSPSSQARHDTLIAWSPDGWGTRHDQAPCAYRHAGHGRRAADRCGGPCIPPCGPRGRILPGELSWLGEHHPDRVLVDGLGRHFRPPGCPAAGVARPRCARAGGGDARDLSAPRLRR